MSVPLIAFVWVISVALLVGIPKPGLGAQPGGPPVADVPPPEYRFKVRLDSEAHTISGTVTVTLHPEDSRVGKGWLFHLPPNRFLERDSRGRRRSVDSLSFATDFSEKGAYDSLWPDGFSKGGIDLQRIVDGADGPRAFSLEDNPDIPQGFSVREGLLRIPPAGTESSGNADSSKRRSITLTFTTRLPERFWEGWSDRGLLAELWHPVLAERRNGNWVTDPFAPRAGTYRVNLSSDRPGRLFLGRGWKARIESGDAISTGSLGRPMRSLPLVFMEKMQMRFLHDYDLSLESFYAEGHERGGEWALKVAAGFMEFVREKYRLSPPDTRIVLIEAPLPPGDIRTVGSLVLIPSEYFSNPPLLDRVFLAQLTRALAQVWFGESVWSNRDLQTWLHLGLPGYLALDFFQSLYGWNAGIHNIVDWLQPKYREHFFEAPVRDMMRRDKDAPLMISIRNHQGERSAILAAHHKAPLVFRSLFHLVGRDAFSKGLNALYFGHRYREVTESDFIRILEEIAGRDLEPFVRDWFYGTPNVDFSVEDWDEEATPLGVRVLVKVRRTGARLLPVDVLVRTEGGFEDRQRWEGTAEAAVLEFQLPESVAEIVIDPEEHWLELDRKNNHSRLLVRVRPLFDWAKQREMLVALRGTGGGNAIDGNYLGLGVNLQFNENNSLKLIPIYGSRTGLRNYLVLWEWHQFLHPSLLLSLKLEKLGGTTLQGVGIVFDLVDTDDYFLKPGMEARKETVREAGYLDLKDPENPTPVFQPAGVANNLRYLLAAGKKQGVYYGNRLELEWVDGRPSYGSEFEFRTGFASFNQSLAVGNDHTFDLLLLRGASEGDVPLQMRHPLGGPEGLRGYPRTLELSYEEMVAARFEYGFTFTRSIHGVSAQVRSMTLFMFGDVGRGWADEERLDSRPQRQNLGLGIEVVINLLRMVEFPVRADVAVPIRDGTYRDPQYVLFGVFAF